MACDQNNALVNALLDRFDTEFPAGSFLDFRTGPAAGAENSAGGTLLCSITLPTTPWAAASSGAKAKNGTWSAATVAAGNIGHYRLRNAAGTRIVEGTVTVTGGGGDATVDTIAATFPGTITCTAFGYSMP